MTDISLFQAYTDSQMTAVALEVINSGLIASGEYVKLFEDGLASLLSKEYVVTTNDMTSAVQLALHLSGVEQGDEVITTAFACMATNSPIAILGAKAVWVDVKEGTVFMDPIELEKAITHKTKAVILYHVAGYPGYVDAISKVCKKHKIKLIEDCDNAMLAMVDGEYVGSIGDFGVLSFYPNRQINTFEGGALICKQKNDAEKARKLRRFGIDFNSFRTTDGEINPNSDIPKIGWSVTLNNLCSAVGYHQLATVKERQIQTIENVQLLNEYLATHELINVIEPIQGTVPAYWVYLITVDNRDYVLRCLKEAGIRVSSLHQRNDLYSCFATNGLKSGSNTEKLQNSIIAMPCGWWLNEKDISRIITVLIRVINTGK